jgi:thiamine biosynthesis protein ThiI
VFGISSLSHATAVPPKLEAMKKAALEYAQERKDSFDTFRISCQRLDSKFPISSMELERELGSVIVDTLHKKVSLKQPQLNIHLEIADQAYLFSKKIDGPGGLPVGSEGKVIVLMDEADPKRSLLSAYLMLRRGCRVFPAGKQELVLDPLNKYSSGSKLEFHEIKSFEGLDRLAAERKILAIAVPDMLDSIKEYPLRTMVLRPLVGYTEKELEEMADRLFKEGARNRLALS